MNRPGPGDWAAHLRAVAGPAATTPPRGLGAIQRPFTAMVCGDSPGAPGDHRDLGDAAAHLWWAVVDNSLDVEPLLAGPGGDGPLLARDRYRAIEVWTDSELSAVHALWHLVQRRARQDWARRLSDAINWHLLHTQPDNATNRPWALHAFLLRGTPEATHYAETLLHNALAASGVPEVNSAWILLDAARALELGDRVA